MHRILILFLLIFFNNHAQIQNDIEEVFPIFPICKLIPDNKQNQCFDESMFEHIEKNFKYPQTAWDLDLESLVRIRFVINENGEVDNILQVPVEKPTKIVFGGKNLNSIYVTSIGKDFDNTSNLNGFTLEISNNKYQGFKTTKFDYWIY